VKSAGRLVLFVSASALLLTACASQGPVRDAAAGPAGANTVVSMAHSPAATPAIASAAAPAKSANSMQAVTVAGKKSSGPRREIRDGVEYFCERPAPTGSHFIAEREQCYTADQLKAQRERDQEFVRRQQAHTQ